MAEGSSEPAREPTWEDLTLEGALGREIVPKPASSRDKRGFGCGWNIENFRTQVQLGRFQREFKLILISFHLGFYMRRSAQDFF